MLTIETISPNFRVDRLMLTAIVGMAFSAALSQFVIIGLLGLPLMPLFFTGFCLGCWRYRAQAGMSAFVFLGGVVLLCCTAAVLIAAFWGANLSLLSTLAASRSAMAPPSFAEWLRPVGLWLFGSLGVGIGFRMWTEWNGQGVILWALLTAAIFPVAVVAFKVMAIVCPISA